MKNTWKRLLPVLAVLAALCMVLTACGGSYSDSWTGTIGGITISGASKSEVAVSKDEIRLNQTYSVSKADVEAEGVKVISDTSIRNENGIIKVERTVAVSRDVLEQENGIISTLTGALFTDNDDILYVNLTFNYDDSNGLLLSVTVECEGNIAVYVVDEETGELVLKDVELDSEMNFVLSVVLNQAAEDGQITGALVSYASEMYIKANNFVSEYRSGGNVTVEQLGDCTAIGSSGEAYWALYSDGVLKISGSGEMGSYLEIEAPWDAYRDLIKRVEMDGDVTNIGPGAFKDCVNLTRVKLGSKVKIIGEEAFKECSKLNWFWIPRSVEEIQANVFESCTNLKNLYTSFLNRAAFESSVRIDSTNEGFFANISFTFNFNA